MQVAYAKLVWPPPPPPGHRSKTCTVGQSPCFCYSQSGKSRKCYLLVAQLRGKVTFFLANFLSVQVVYCMIYICSIICSTLEMSNGFDQTFSCVPVSYGCVCLVFAPGHPSFTWGGGEISQSVGHLVSVSTVTLLSPQMA